MELKGCLLDIRNKGFRLRFSPAKLRLNCNVNGNVLSIVFIQNSRLKVAEHSVVIMGHMERCFSCIIHGVLHSKTGNMPIRIWASAKNQTTGEFMKI